MAAARAAAGAGPAAAPAAGTSSKRVVIVGGGIIGASTAFYLSQHQPPPAAITVVERHALAGAASGKAGGFLALDWNDSSPVGPLARHSYRLHQQLAERFGSDAIGYRAVDTISITGGAAVGRGGGSKAAAAAARPPGLPGWLDGSIARSSVLGTTSTTAQVHPARLTRALMDAAEAGGARLLIGTVTGISTGPDGAVAGVRMQQQQQQEEQELPADVLVLAMGPWTGAAIAWLPSAPRTTGECYHSVVLRPETPVTATCVFTSLRTADGRSIQPELYPRVSDGTVYVCGEPASLPVPPEGPAGVRVEASSLQVLKDVAGSLASSLSGAAVEAEQACYLPLCDDGLPAIGRLPGVEGAYVGTGHSCWGILNGPATGEALAELIMHGKASSVNLAPFDPARFSRRR